MIRFVDIAPDAKPKTTQAPASERKAPIAAKAAEPATPKPVKAPRKAKKGS